MLDNFSETLAHAFRSLFESEKTDDERAFESVMRDLMKVAVLEDQDICAVAMGAFVSKGKQILTRLNTPDRQELYRREILYFEPFRALKEYLGAKNRGNGDEVEMFLDNVLAAFRAVKEHDPKRIFSPLMGYTSRVPTAYDEILKARGIDVEAIYRERYEMQIAKGPVQKA